MTLQELDGVDWGEPTFPSRLVTECHRLRRVPLNELTVEDLRLLIGQEMSLEYLVPLALPHLQSDPWNRQPFIYGKADWEFLTSYADR